jgi:tungstate transport system substrate-binding protein
MKKRIDIIIWFVLLFFNILLFKDYIGAGNYIKMATTTSLYETGLLDYLIGSFEKSEGISVHVISVGTGKALKLGMNGDVDVILVHAPEAEIEFIRDGYGTGRKTLMRNEFIIIGPERDPANIKSSKNALSAFKNISSKRKKFISRGDDSGTHKKEKSLWRELGVLPEGNWYLESGRGMTETIMMADEFNAYCLTDRATYLMKKKELRLIQLLQDGESLDNRYSVIAVDPEKNPHVKYELVLKFISWLGSRKCLGMIGAYKVEDEVLFHSEWN